MAGEFHFGSLTDRSGRQQRGFEDIFAEDFLMGGGAAAGRTPGPRPEAARIFTAAVTVSFDEADHWGGTRRVVLQNGEQIDVKIPVGVKEGQQIRVKGRGGAGQWRRAQWRHPAPPSRWRRIPA